MRAYAWIHFALVEVLFTVLAALACVAIPPDYPKYTVTVCLAVVVAWLVVTFLNASELIRRLRFANAERDAHRALARNLEGR